MTSIHYQQSPNAFQQHPQQIYYSQTPSSMIPSTATASTGSASSASPGMALQALPGYQQYTGSSQPLNQPSFIMPQGMSLSHMPYAMPLQMENTSYDSTLSRSEGLQIPPAPSSSHTSAYQPDMKLSQPYYQSDISNQYFHGGIPQTSSSTYNSMLAPSLSAHHQSQDPQYGGASLLTSSVSQSQLYPLNIPTSSLNSVAMLTPPVSATSAIPGGNAQGIPMGMGSTTPNSTPGSTGDETTPKAKGRRKSKNPANPPPRKRTTRACDQCNHLRTKCDGKQPCSHCIAVNLDCQYLRVPLKRGKASLTYLESVKEKKAQQKAKAAAEAAAAAAATANGAPANYNPLQLLHGSTPSSSSPSSSGLPSSNSSSSVTSSSIGNVTPRDQYLPPPPGSYY